MTVCLSVGPVINSTGAQELLLLCINKANRVSVDYKTMSERDLVDEGLSGQWFVRPHTSDLKPLTRQQQFNLWSWSQGGHRIMSQCYSVLTSENHSTRSDKHHSVFCVCESPACDTTDASSRGLNICVEKLWSSGHSALMTSAGLSGWDVDRSSQNTTGHN